MAERYEVGLDLIDAIGARHGLAEYHLYHAARSDRLRRFERVGEAATAYRQAITRSSNDAERSYLERRLCEVMSAP